MICLFDTETTGFPVWNEPSDDPRQPHIVQIVATVWDWPAERCYASMNCIIRPDGRYTIPEDIAKIHGLTTEDAQTYGIDRDIAYQMFWQLVSRSEAVGAHNLPFDKRMLRILEKRLVNEGWEIDPDDMKLKRGIDTATLATDLCKLPPTEAMLRANRKGFKKPTLTEAYEALTGKKMEDAHTALGDVKALLAVYRACYAAGKIATYD